MALYVLSVLHSDHHPSLLATLYANDIEPLDFMGSDNVIVFRYEGNSVDIVDKIFKDTIGYIVCDAINVGGRLSDEAWTVLGIKPEDVKE